MRHLHRSKVVAQVLDAVPDLTGVPGVHDLVVEGSVVSCTVEPDGLPAVLGALTAAGVRTLTSSPPSLEELFLDAYRKDPVG
jgi:ABC-2 type transport system ATP-binding protein